MVDIMSLEIKDLHVEAEGKEVVRGVSIKVQKGEVHVIMGPNGSGKTTLAKAVMGHPSLAIKGGEILLNGENITSLLPNERARKGLFMEFQNPVEIDGLGFLNFLNSARGALSDEKYTYKDFISEIKDNASKLKIREDLISRPLNYGFSGGEKKKMEILQMAVLKPKFAILDEPDSGLDVDAVRIVAQGINDFHEKTGAGIIIITHYSRILSHMQPNFIHVMKDGKIIREGGNELVQEVESKGYEYEE